MRYSLVGLLLLVLGGTAVAELPVVRIGIAIDGPRQPSKETLRDSLLPHIRELTQVKFDVRFPEDKMVMGDGSVAGARAALDRLLSDDEVDLLIADSIMGFMTFLGIISLSGIVINNAIVLLDRIKLEIEDNGLESARGVEAAAQRRLRPIVLTICTTVGGMLPLGLVLVLYALFFRVKFKEFTY